MDTDGKAFSTPFPEVREKKYVALDVASEISGYTKTYLERLCRLNQVEHLLWNKGGFVIELESLLRTTHTILVSPEKVSFVNDKELVPLPPAEPALVEPIEAPVLDMPHKPATSSPSSLPAMSVPRYSDEWDALLFSGEDDVEGGVTKRSSDAVFPLPPLYETPSLYRPIQTSSDPSQHHDDAPLFPRLLPKGVAVPMVGTKAATPMLNSPADMASALPKFSLAAPVTPPETHSP